MGRRSSRPSGGRRAAPARAPARSASTAAARRPAQSRPAPPPATTRAPPARSSSSAPANQKNAAAPPPATQAPQQGSAMGGFMANVASTGLGVMAGRAMDRAFFGGGSAPAPEQGAEGVPPPIEAGQDYASNQSEMIDESVCAREALEFKKCMERNSSNVAACQWNIDILAACQQQQQQQLGFADAGRL